ncbi:cytochrome c3 family protein [Geomonas propionica]|uniref:Doubled CXXCH motif domain-containing protein n=1 Tax=Geomonas propionica TaxID=2798582 RepID=A0ABS0YUA4_9BACT|nr:cytochrome c3 family protein [Geomonas propionica]MBJ6801095.1 hypothetical protein [Geomonas propionica]
MKKQFVAVAAIAGLALGAAIANGADSKGAGIVGSVHDLSGNAGFGGAGSTYGVKDPGGRICAFCHSPHHSNENNQTWNGTEVTNLGTNLDPLTAADETKANQYYVYAPLWSRTDLGKAVGYEPYKSQTFSPDSIGKAYDPLIGPSRLCLTCHDGSIALDSYYGQTGSANIAASDAFGGPEGGSKNIGIAKGMGLSNDHPIGMKYTDYLNTADNVTDYELMPTGTKFRDSSNSQATTKSIQSVLYTDPMLPEVKDFVTCASCHDVHNGKAVGNTAPLTNMRGYLLYGAQVNSAFCLTCHDKSNGTVPLTQ